MKCAARRFQVGVTGAWLAIAGVAANPPSPDTFLDRPVPSGLKLDPYYGPSQTGKGASVEYRGLSVSGLAEGVRQLEKISGKKLVLPLPFEAEVANELKIQDQPTKGSWYGVDPKMSVRELFNRLCIGMGLVPHYDPARDAIVLNVDWRRDDPRSGAELVRFLASNTPVSWETLPYQTEKNIVDGHSKALDPWRIAFDALLSKPENFGNAGLLRIYHDEHSQGGMGYFPVMNMLSHQMRDSSGRNVLLILNTQLPTFSKSPPGDVAYYLFDEAGTFLKGGVYAMGEDAQGSTGKAKIDSPGAVTIDVAFGLQPDHAHFALENGDLVFKGATASDGSEMSAAEASVATYKMPHPPVPISRTYPAFSLNPDAPAVTAPVAPAVPTKPIHWHGAIGVRKFTVG